MESKESCQQRKHIRLKVWSLTGELSIERICGTTIQSLAKPILLIDISPYGLRFQSDLHFPVSKKLVLKVTTKLVGQIRVELTGRLIWRSVIDNMYEYGMQLEITNPQAILLRRLLNELLQEMSPQHKEIHRLYKRTSAIHLFHSIGEVRRLHR